MIIAHYIIFIVLAYILQESDFKEDFVFVLLPSNSLITFLNIISWTCYLVTLQFETRIFLRESCLPLKTFIILNFLAHFVFFFVLKHADGDTMTLDQTFDLIQMILLSLLLITSILAIYKERTVQDIGNTSVFSYYKESERNLLLSGIKDLSQMDF